MSQSLRAPKKPRVSIIFDTSAIYSEKYDFSKCIKDLSRFTNLNYEIYLPEIVVEERKRQLQENIEHKYSELARLSDFFQPLIKIKLSKRVNIDKLRENSIRKFNIFLKKHEINVVPTPYNILDLRNIVNDALEKKTLFKSKDTNAFKDYMILQTIANHLNSVKQRQHIIFVCDDPNLHEEVSSLIRKKQDYCLKVNELEERLTRISQNLNEKTTNKLLLVARSIFFNGETSTGLWFDKVKGIINDKYSPLLNDPDVIYIGMDGLGTFSFGNWKSEDAGKYLIDNPILSDVKQKKYYFKTTINFMRKFTKANSLLLLQSLTGTSLTDSSKSLFGDAAPESLELPTTHDMKVTFSVSWNAVNSSGIKLANPTVDRIDYLTKNSPS